MIISASRRTDIPAFYSRWFMNRIHAGYCHVPNPFNPKQVSCVSLEPEEVDAIVFWTRNPRPIMPYLGELEKRGYPFVFHYTLMDNPRMLDPKSPPLEVALRCFLELSDRLGAERVIWRYDPIVLTHLTDVSFHLRTFTGIASVLQGRTERVHVSLLSRYRKTIRRMRALGSEKIRSIDDDKDKKGQIIELMSHLAEIARASGMQIFSCAEDRAYLQTILPPGKCIDGEYLSRILGVKLILKKDPFQRRNCGCVVSKDIGMYDSCLFECRYCYATSSPAKARANYMLHDPTSPSLIGCYMPQTVQEMQRRPMKKP